MQMLGQMTAIRIKNPSGDPKGLKDKQLEIMDVSYRVGCIRHLAMRFIRFFRMIHTIFPAPGVLQVNVSQVA